MGADWSALAGPGDPVIVAPWSSPEDGLSFVDLRAHPERVDEILEARRLPALRVALLALNQPGGNVWTAKCDAWAMSAEEIEAVRAELDAPPTGAGFASYIDLLPALEEDFARFAAAERRARALARAADSELPDRVWAEFVIRPALADHRHGYGLTAYLYALDDWNPRSLWTAALRRVTAQLAPNSG